MNAIDVLLASLDEAFDRKGWHGTNLRGSVRGLSVEEILWRPAAGRHNIFELALHTAYWKYVVRRRLRGEKRGSFPRKGSDWFPSPKREVEEEWRAAVVLMEEQHRALRETVEAIDPRQLDAKTRHLIAGAAAHDLYHAGQIQLIKRLQRSRGA